MSEPSDPSDGFTTKDPVELPEKPDTPKITNASFHYNRLKIIDNSENNNIFKQNCLKNYFI